ncbi:zinc-dependent peptidase [Cognatilysobacter lacus]|uniref:Zinc-dependent peptidase n=1 Tax=Cognatilysobacter lacus TaxID=1643323 RepID=A0A5D8YNR3_9GAMM|nr:M90 family metallopeptidase [Lysobacter lacus]TZF81924.1 zinc-dependent peptidase [Lysobacter lacus]
MLGWLRRLARPDRPETPLDPALAADVFARAPWARALDAGRRERLSCLAAWFLRNRAITPVAGLELDIRDRALLSALCCLPVLEFGIGGLRGWSELIVYPDAFRVERSHVDAAGVLHEGQDDLIGESWQAGPLVLSWADVLTDCAAPRDGFCVAAHEMAHKLDALDGDLDGTPPLPRDWHAQWVRDFQAAFDGLNARLDRGKRTPIDDYAAESPDEFFAVATEYHFSAPERLRRAYPAVADHLVRFYGPPPFG